MISWVDKPDVIRVEKSMLDKDRPSFDAWIRGLAFTIRNTMQFENISIVGSHLMHFNRISPTCNYLHLKVDEIYCRIRYCVKETFLPGTNGEETGFVRPFGKTRANNWKGKRSYRNSFSQLIHIYNGPPGFTRDTNKAAINQLGSKPK